MRQAFKLLLLILLFTLFGLDIIFCLVNLAFMSALGQYYLLSLVLAIGLLCIISVIIQSKFFEEFMGPFEPKVEVQEHYYLYYDGKQVEVSENVYKTITQMSKEELKNHIDEVNLQEYNDNLFRGNQDECR